MILQSRGGSNKNRAGSTGRPQITGSTTSNHPVCFNSLCCKVVVRKALNCQAVARVTGAKGLDWCPRTSWCPMLAVIVIAFVQ